MLHNPTGVQITVAPYLRHALCPQVLACAKTIWMRNPRLHSIFHTRSIQGKRLAAHSGRDSRVCQCLYG
jgi:hypothetical protein